MILIASPIPVPIPIPIQGPTTADDNGVRGTNTKGDGSS
jgi:hypothetical protein